MFQERSSCTSINALRKSLLSELPGNYGSEILRSNVAFGPRRLDLSLFTPEFSDLLMGAAETFRTEFAGNTLAFIAFQASALVPLCASCR